MLARAIVAAMGLGTIAGVVPALADQTEPAAARQQVYTYTVRHPTYGEIGTYTDTIERRSDITRERGSDITRIEGCLRIAVKVLGIVAYRLDSDTTEVMSDGRLVSLRSTTDKDGEQLEVHGEARGDQFLVDGTGGSHAGPATIAPTDPWVLKRTGDATVVFTDTGRIFNVHITGGEYEPVSVNGVSVSARHYIVMGVRRQEVWLDGGEIPIMFRIVEDGTPIDFVLQNPTAKASGPSDAVLQHTALARPESNTR